MVCNSAWKETNLRRYKFLEDVTEQILLCFLTWAYYGDYQSYDGEDITPSPLITKAETNGWEDESCFTIAKKSKKDKRRRELDMDVENMSWLPLRGVQISEEPPPEKEPIECKEEKVEEAYAGPSKNKSLPVILATAEDNIVHPLLLHTKLYVFAHLYLIEPLKVISKQKMIGQLQKLGSLSEGGERAAVFDVLAYAFSKLPEEDPLLYWLGHYASWRLEELRQMPTRFDDLLSDEGGNFIKKLVRYVSKSTTSPFNLKDDEIMPRYPMPASRARYDS